LKVFVVTRGEYSDYGIIGVCSTKEKAEELKKLTEDFYMWAKDELHAVKIANERRIRLIESNSWDVDWDKWKELRS
jgi:hypothetical protein